MEWISVKDRLPEIPKEERGKGHLQMQVLVFGKNGMQCAWSQEGTRCFYDKEGFFGKEIEGVTHWMPLPEPPKEAKANV